MRFYLGGTVLFVLGSLGAACSGGAASLIASRVLQGAGASLLASTSAAIVTAAFPSHQRGRALGFNSMAVFAGLSVGPPLGGFLVDRFGWPWIFLINIPIGLAVLLWGWRFLPRREALPPAGQRMDLGGSALLGLLLACLLIPLTFAAEWGWTLFPTFALLALAALLLPAFLAWEGRSPDPLLNLALLRGNRLFARSNLAALLNHMALYSIAILTAVHLQAVQHRPVRTVGWILLGQPIMQALLDIKYTGYLPFVDLIYFAVPDPALCKWVHPTCGLILSEPKRTGIKRESPTSWIKPARRVEIISYFAFVAASRVITSTEYRAYHNASDDPREDASPEQFTNEDGFAVPNKQAPP